MNAVKNTDREIWRKSGDGNGMSYYEPHISVTKDGLITITVGGTGITLPIEEWHKLALFKINPLAPAEPDYTRKKKYPFTGPLWRH